MDWLLQLQYLGTDRRNGAFWNWYHAGTFKEGTGPTFAGWQLAALSSYYRYTLNTTVADAAHKLRRFMVDTLWNNTNKWFNTLTLSTDTWSNFTAWDGMPQGSAALGLAVYYKYVAQNSTVASRLNECLNKGLAKTQNHRFYRGTANYEDSMYAWWGYYYAYKALDNVTYYNESLKAAKLTRANYEQNLNGSQWFNTYMINTTGGFDGWGFACSLPLLFILYEHEGNSNYLELFENQLLDLLPTIKTGNFSITRKRASGDSWVNWQYTPSNAFIVSAFAQYYAKIYKPENPYILSTNKEITAMSYSENKLSFTVSASSGTTSIIKVYVGDKGEPTAVYSTNGTLTWGYDTSTLTLTLNVTHAGAANLLVDWRIPGDVNSDNKVDASDLFYLGKAYGSNPSKPNWNPNCDFNWDDKIDTSDLSTLSTNYGKTKS
jgi:hypothetical protein